MSKEVLLLPQGLLLREATKDQDRSNTVPCLLSTILLSNYIYSWTVQASGMPIQ